ncbi:MAG: von Willebrand factor type A domain-containing protein [Candidatus Omnitrophica bacterium]|nr:von Willebrand factor type A domain-containing protein [Candidatus Omnitrophota bacterium]
MIEHNKIQELLSVYFDGEATTEEKEIIERHIKDCKDCAREFNNFSQISSSLKLYPESTLSPDFELKLNSKKENKMKTAETKTKLDHYLKPVLAGEVAIIIAALILIGSVTLQTFTKRQMAGKLKNAADNIGEQYSPGNTNRAPSSNVSGTKKATIKKAYQSLSTTDHKTDELVKVEKSSQSQSDTARYEGSYLGKAYDISKTADKSGKGYATERELIDSSLTSAKVWMITVSRERDEVLRTNMPYPAPFQREDFNTEEYSSIVENEFLTVSENPLSTFSIDVDTASYSNVRRYINSNQLPPVDAIRIEEMVNYFTYDYPKPEGDEPFSITTKAAQCPWNKDHDLFLVGLQGKVPKETPNSNLVFLIDTSGSMNQPNKLPLLISAFSMMVNQLGDKEKVAIVTYAGSAGKVLDSTSGSDKQSILEAINRLYAGGSTAGNAGIQLAYTIAKENFIAGGNNRVILATDGDFNVGVSSTSELSRMIEEKRKDGIFLTILGFGDGNYKDGRMQELADKGNGNYYYIDTLKEAKKVLVNELGSTLFTIAKDVKIQIEFNPSQVKAYRLIGYENRMLKKEDFNNDTKDAGELGAGHTVTAIYEIVRSDSGEQFAKVDDLKYQEKKVINSDETMTVKLRYKDPEGDTSKLLQQTINKQDIKDEPSGDFKFASAVAEYGLLLRNSKFKGLSSYENVLKAAKDSKGEDKFGYREEFIQLVEQTNTLDSRAGAGGINFKGSK